MKLKKLNMKFKLCKMKNQRKLIENFNIWNRWENPRSLKLNSKFCINGKPKEVENKLQCLELMGNPKEFENDKICLLLGHSPV